ncbi:MAG: class I SAM-dependent methyltransferase [Cocleimonas sp.]
MEASLYFNSVQKIIANGGPEPSEYSFIKSLPDLSTISLTDEAQIYDILSPILDVKSLLGYTFQKPRGYAGDFELIDRIYNKWISDDVDFQKWDTLYHELESSKAVINRKKYFIDEITSLNNKKQKLEVLDLGSGPCTDLYEYLYKTKENYLYFDCLDMDEGAIEFGLGVCDNYYKNVSFINKNAFRYNPDKEYDLIWSAGLFDYFSDKLFVRLLNRMYTLLSVDGELIIGNFSTTNPSRRMMETYAQWYLNHRSEEELIELAIKAGISEDKLEVRSEELGINLFLHAKK